MTGKWTPGPWKRSEHAADRIEGLSSTNGLARTFGGIASVYGVPNNCGFEEIADDTRFQEGNANANLIAAAPDLLVICERIEAHVKAGAPAEEGRLLRKEMQAAIAKAKGETK